MTSRVNSWASRNQFYNLLVSKICDGRVQEERGLEGNLLFKSLISLSIGSAKIEDDYNQIEYRGMKGSETLEAWNEMDKIAKLLSSNVTYIKQ